MPAVVVVMVGGDGVAGGFEKIFVFVLAVEGGFDVEEGFAGDVEEGNAEIAGGSSGGGFWRSCDLRKERGQPLFRERQGKHFLQREHDRGAAEGFEKRAAGGRQKKRYLSLRAPC